MLDKLAHVQLLHMLRDPAPSIALTLYSHPWWNRSSSNSGIMKAHCPHAEFYEYYDLVSEQAMEVPFSCSLPAGPVATGPRLLH